MKKVELLAPAGNKDMLIAAINNGADAVYLAGKSYGARHYAQNFSNDELKEAIDYAHLYGVKIYVTINTLICESEVEEFLKYVLFLYKSNVDAVLMQDLGMINLVRKIYPNLVIHASTQAHNHNKEGIKYLKDIGVERVVLARELSIEEINNIDIPIEKEVFVYGALCISYSGQCFMSSSMLKRSANRGKCAGMCRLPYELCEENNKIKTEGNYLLSPKELNVLPRLREVISSNVDSLKIEGRMKSPEYVAYVTRLFRRLIDNYYNNEPMNVSEKEINNLRKLYNRDFTLGHLFQEKNNKLMNIKSPNHIGTHLGNAKVVKNKIQIELDDDISQGDGIRFGSEKGMIVNYLYDKDMLLTNFVPKNSIAYVDNKLGIKQDCEVLKTLDKVLIEQINDSAQKKIPVDIVVNAQVGTKFWATINDGTNTITKYTDYVVEQAKTSAVSKQEIVDKFSRLNDTPFRLNDIEINSSDNIFISIKIINQLRRELVEDLIKERIKIKKEIVINEYVADPINTKPTNTINVLAQNENQIKSLIDKNVNILTPDPMLYKKYKNNNVFLVTNRVGNYLADLSNDNILASNLSSVYKYSNNNNVISSIYLNVTNSYTLKVLHDMNVKIVGLSFENDFDNLELMINNFKKRYKSYPNVSILVHGRIELMVMNHCLLNMFVNKQKNCKICHSGNSYFLKDRNSKKLPIINRNCNTYLLNCDITNLLDDISWLKSINVNNYVVTLYDETEKEIDKILTTIKDKLN